MVSISHVFLENYSQSYMEVCVVFVVPMLLGFLDVILIEVKVPELLRNVSQPSVKEASHLKAAQGLVPGHSSLCSAPTSTGKKKRKKELLQV